MADTRQKSTEDQWQADPALAWRPLPLPLQRYAADLHEMLLDRWSGDLPAGTPILKTDLYEEAMGQDYPAARINTMGWRVLGMDLGKGIARQARRRNNEIMAVNADARALPFSTDSLPAIFSNSTLDHFEKKEDLIRSLGEIHRVLRPGGRLLLTLDNAQCPIVALRNALPRSFTDGAGITNFYVGQTLTLRGTENELRRLGFVIRKSGTFMHAIRWFALPLLRRIEAARREGKQVTSALKRAECLRHLPTARWTGHFIYVDAQKESAPLPAESS